MSSLETYANRMAKEGWSIVSISVENVVLKRKKDPNTIVVIAGFVGLLFYFIPGILILILAYATRSDETFVVTAEQAAALEEQEALQRAEEENTQREKEEKFNARFPRLSKQISRVNFFVLVGICGFVLFIIILATITGG